MISAERRNGELWDCSFLLQMVPAGCKNIEADGLSLFGVGEWVGGVVVLVG